MNQLSDPLNMDFDAWLELINNDPDAFEETRLLAIDSLIQNAPEKYQRRLRGLQWRVDQERRLARTPMDACVRISNLMWENLTGPRGMLENFRQLNEALHEFDEDMPLI